MILLAVVHLLPVPGKLSAHLAVDQPIATAAALVLGPIEMGVLGFISSFDPDEFRGGIPPSKAIFNRVQTALSYAAGSALVHAIVDLPESSPHIILLAFLALSAQALTNYLLVGTAIAVEQRHSLAHVVRQLRLGTVGDFWLSFMACGVLGAMLAALHDQVQPLTMLAVLGPVLLARQALQRSQMFVDTSQAYKARGEALAQISTQIHEERSDERRLIAADLHDEVLQPLFKVTLMAHVVKADLATGRLLAMDEDLPALVQAAELASGSLRELIGDLRKSTIGRGGLSAAVTNLVKTLGQHPSIRVEAQIGDVWTDSTTELVLYQIAKEALVNAASHSKAKLIRIELNQDGKVIHLAIHDDGEGFDPLSAREGHYGLDIMRERAASIGSFFCLDAERGAGCRVDVTVPQAPDPGER